MYKIDKISKESTVINIITRVISIIIYIILIPIIIFNITLIFKSFINPNKTPDFLGYKNYVIVSKSMEPTIRVGDAIFTKEKTQDEIKVNDIVSFNDGNDITTHRIVKIEERNGNKIYTTKGDNNNSEDRDKVTYSEIEGVYQFKIHQFGTIVKILKSKVTLVIMISALIINIVLNNRLKTKKDNRRKKRIEYEEEKLKNK